MANSPVDKSKDFIKSGMTLITEIASDRYLEKSKKVEKSKINKLEQ
tara:strand:+ start:615 stop:752 length:138 start_codon:yes stop_codon:yes gene_type:complete